ncbi:asparaginase [Noviherbaspirillum galbum]|uniref:Asparaginase n=1 Tax=Noviherbaspirillum galbum TaxID=2709383 RepID=A0A6B3SYW2_9BURK|nr:asparaginase [Noviherbaspirillum galbum]NEX64876.1 asparaginase [Noviherbaspirillum galbum]
MTPRRVLLVSTGGTITMTSGGPAGGISPTLTGEDLVRAVPELARRADLEVVSYSMMPGASLSLGDLVRIADLVDGRMATDFMGAVVVQGTDTIEDTAFILDMLVKSDNPVVVTGAMRGPAAPGADGPANLLAAVTVASSTASAGLGAVAVLNDEIHAGSRVQKSHTALPSAFTSPGFGPFGRVIEGRVHRYARLPRLQALARPADADATGVALVTIPLGDDGRLLDALPGLGYRGAVIEAMGAGHLPARVADKVEALAAVMPVVLSTRVQAGPVFQGTYGFKGSEMDLIARGAIPGGYLTAGKACLLLRLLIANGLSGDALRDAFHARSNTPLVETPD